MTDAWKLPAVLCVVPQYWKRGLSTLKTASVAVTGEVPKGAYQIRVPRSLFYPKMKTASVYEASKYTSNNPYAVVKVKVKFTLEHAM